MRVKTNFWIDLLILVLFLAGFEPALTGGVVHEWLNLTFAGVMLVHLVVHWNWIRSMVGRSLKTMSRSSQVNLFLNILLFLVFVMMILSGLMISKNVLAPAGTAVPPRSAWHGLHETFGNMLLVLIGMHFAMHWKWIAHTVKRCLFEPSARPFEGQLTGEGRMS